uniref:FecR family protein n=1 Tax=Flavobacterium sp. TaxID=239 RepID=UPI00404B386B
MEHKKDRYLADWLADEISDEQLQQLVSREDFLAYKKLRFALEHHQISEPNLEENYLQIQEKIHQKKEVSKSKIFQIWPMTAVAASLLLLFGWYQVFYFSNEIATDFGATKTITLKDDSVVTLNAKSTLSYANQFQWNRTLKLEGEAFFEVEKGDNFVVETALGRVKVLGTKFNVNIERDFFEVHCYEGKVQVTINDAISILTPNKSVRFSSGRVELNEDLGKSIPTWIENESSFVNVPFEIVVNKLIKQFQKDIVYPEKFQKIKFTGNFSNTDLEFAIKSITIPLKLNYSMMDNKIILSE